MWLVRNCFLQVVLDLGHVTFSNVSDWSTDETDLGEEPVGLEIGEDDDGEKNIASGVQIFKFSLVM